MGPAPSTLVVLIAHEEEQMVNRTLARLDREWTGLEASPAARRALARWAEAEPALAGFATLGEVLAGRDADRAGANAILSALARLASGDELAARTLLQALLPGIVVVAAREPLAGDRGCVAQLASLAWTRIRTYPTSRRGSVAANVLKDVRKMYLADRAIGASAEPLDADDRSGPTVPSAEELAIQRTCVAGVYTAHRDGVIGDVAMQLIVRTRVDGVSIAEAAAELGAGIEWSTCVRWRAERRLQALLAAAG